MTSEKPEKIDTHGEVLAALLKEKIGFCDLKQLSLFEGRPVYRFDSGAAENLELE